MCSFDYHLRRAKKRYEDDILWMDRLLLQRNEGFVQPVSCVGQGRHAGLFDCVFLGRPDQICDL